MKKGLKKIISLMLAMMLVLGMGVTALAAEIDNTVSAETGKTPDTSTHSYVAYKIFEGTQAEDDAALASIKWADEEENGSSTIGAAILAEVTKNDLIKVDFTGKTTAQQVAEVVSAYGDDSDKARAFAKCVYAAVKGTTGTPITVGQEMDTGYYLIVDVTTFGDTETNTAYNLALLQLTNKGKFEIKNKTDIPTVEKKVQEINDTTGADPVWQDGADYDIGDDIKFQLTGTLPSNYDDYGNYNFVFHDTLSKGLTYKAILSVKVNGERDITPTATSSVTNEDGITELTISFGDLKEIDEELKAGDKIIVEYTATLNDAAKVGSTGNPNEVYLEYSNNPNDGGNGKTPKDKVIVFTFVIEANKVKEDGTALKGAGFTLYKWDKTANNWVAVVVGKDTEGNPITELSGEDLTIFEFEGMDSGKYKLEETTVPEGYNKAEDIEFEVRAKYDTSAADPKLTDLEVYDKNGNLVSEGEDAVFTATVGDGKVSTDVVNKGGVALPETGGIGTTIFYILGGVLVLGCVVILMARKRKGKNL